MKGFRRLAIVASIALSKAQSPEPFEVAVIRPSIAPATSGTSFNTFAGGRLKIANQPVKLLIRAAFQIQNAQIAGGPPWLETDRYDIEAKTGHDKKLTPAQTSPLLQSLLAERFNLKFHREIRELTVYALVPEKSAPKLKPSDDGESTAMNTHNSRGKSQLVGTAVPMGPLASYIGNRLGRIVVDKTGLAGCYNFTLEWAPDDASLVTALREQLGLRLESQKSPVEVLVIDNLQKPSEN